MINILLTEDHNVVRDGIRSLLEKENKLEVVGEATNGQQALNLLAGGLEVDVILADLNMPEVGGMEMAAEVKIKYPKVKVIILSMLDHEKYILEAFKIGANGYILKNVTADELIFAINHVYNNNERYICTELALRLLDKVLHKPEIITSAETPETELSKREIEVLILIAEGFTNQEIADKLFSSKRTVEGHRQNLIDKTNTRNTAALIRYAIISGLIN